MGVVFTAWDYGVTNLELSAFVVAIIAVWLRLDGELVGPGPSISCPRSCTPGYSLRSTWLRAPRLR